MCNEAIKYDFKSVCVTPVNVSLCAKLLAKSDVLVCTVIGFPHGSQTTNTKELETLEAVYNGANEIDMVINVSELKQNHEVSKKHYVYKEIKRLRSVTKGLTLKVILETGLLTDEEVVVGCKLAKLAGADFVKTSTGYSGVGATENAVSIMVANADGMSVKASGGIRSYADAKKYIDLGVKRIGTSAGVAIMEGEENVNTSY